MKDWPKLIQLVLNFHYQIKRTMSIKKNPNKLKDNLFTLINDISSYRQADKNSKTISYSNGRFIPKRCRLFLFRLSKKYNFNMSSLKMKISNLKDYIENCSKKVYVIQTLSWWILIWDALIAVIILINMISIPLQICFEGL